MKQGDFTQLAKSYVNRSGYSLKVLRALGTLMNADQKDDFRVADVGAGTGKLTENLVQCGFNCVAVEPNEAMREEGKRCTAKYDVEWREGSGEDTGLETASVDWITMGSSFHWVDTERGLKEFHRVLRPGGYFTAVWNPRNLEQSELHVEIEDRIRTIVPELKRVSSGSAKNQVDVFEQLTSTGHFSDCLLIEDQYDISMSKERYLGAWESVNDIQAQAGPERFAEIMNMIDETIRDLEAVIVPYKTRAWSVRRND